MEGNMCQVMVESLWQKSTLVEHERWHGNREWYGINLKVTLNYGVSEFITTFGRVRGCYTMMILGWILSSMTLC